MNIISLTGNLGKDNEVKRFKLLEKRKEFRESASGKF